MARTLTEIRESLGTSLVEVLDGSPSTSHFAEWKIWQNIFAIAIWTFENIMDIFKGEIEILVYSKKVGSMGWYYDRVLEFQGENDPSGVFQGDSLIVNDQGIIQYENIDEGKRIITQAAIAESEGAIIVKVAKDLDESNYQKLEAPEVLAFEVYLDNIHIPGTNINVISQSPDLIKYNLTIYYDPIFTVTTIQANAEENLNEYRTGQGMNDKIYKQKLVEKVLQAEGVVSVGINSIEAKAETDSIFSDIGIVYSVEAGYFNYDNDSNLTLISYKNL